ncbi:hypothetical protein [Altererythrobacter sp. GH1-8]|uniref:hypothetical protein n=1 Tax=Altererythrobacter sp. GH1-8 TaxID=3349333 RepID=UPI00374D09DD
MRMTLTLLGAASFVLASCGGGSAPEEPNDTGGSEEVAQEPVSAAESEDALVPGTQYNATAQIPCGFAGEDPTQNCDAGVIRNWGEDGTTLVEVQKPDGSKRAIFVQGTTPIGADSAEADGSAGWDFKTTRDGDRVTVNFGPESYIIVDAFVEGG